MTTLNKKSPFLAVLNSDRDIANGDGLVYRPTRAIREKIYRYAFVSDEYLGGKAMQTRDFKRHLRHLWQESFSVSCHQIYNEVRPIFLGENGYEFNYIKPFWGFLQIIGIEGRRLIRSLRFNFHGVGRPHRCSFCEVFWRDCPFAYIEQGSPFRVLRYLRGCSRLQSLEIFIVVKMNKKDYREDLQNKGFTLQEIKTAGFKSRIQNAIDCFVGDDVELDYGDFIGYGGVTRDSHWTSAMQREGLAIQMELSEALQKVKAEERGMRVRFVRPQRRRYGVEEERQN